MKSRYHSDLRDAELTAPAIAPVLFLILALAIALCVVVLSKDDRPRVRVYVPVADRFDTPSRS